MFYFLQPKYHHHFKPGRALCTQKGSTAPYSSHSGCSVEDSSGVPWSQRPNSYFKAYSPPGAKYPIGSYSSQWEVPIGAFLPQTISVNGAISYLKKSTDGAIPDSEEGATSDSTVGTISDSTVGAISNSVVGEFSDSAFGAKAYSPSGRQDSTCGAKYYFNVARKVALSRSKHRLLGR